MPKVSILLPVLNGVGTVHAALRSLLSQSFDGFEVLVLDDGSIDGTTEAVRSVQDNRIIVQQVALGTQRGITARLNQGITVAKGKYIARMDADDIALPGRLEAQARFLDENPDVSVVGTRAVAFDTKGKAIGLLPFRANHEALCQRPWRGIPLPHPTWMGRTEWFRGHRYRDVARAEDQELLLRASGTSRYACLPEVYLAYRQGPFNLNKTLLARKSLFRAQMGWFLSRREWGNAVACAAITVAKLGADAVAAIPGMDSAYFARMGEPVPEPVLAQLRALGVIG
jgi:glycosyltransferase involved in cell wall biosynthesis